MNKITVDNLVKVFKKRRVVKGVSFDIEEGKAFAEVNIGGERRTLYDDTAVGFDAQGREVVRVTVDEPIHERPGKLNSI